MREIYKELEKKCDSLKAYNLAIKKILKLPLSEQRETDPKRVFVESNGKIFHHDLVIINAYGIVEWFTEQIIKAYLNDISKVVEKFASLPEDICDKHLSLSVDLLKNKERMGTKYQHLKSEDIIKNLYSCLDEKEDFKINTDAFTYHSSNLRKEAINSLFKNIGIENISHKIVMNSELRKVMAEIDGEDETGINLYKEDKFFERLNDLVEQRNHIAHGVPTTDILSAEELDSCIIYINSLLNAMYDEVYKHYLRLVIKSRKCVCLGNPQKVFPRLKVMSFKSNYMTIQLKQTIVGYNCESDGMTFGIIDNIKKESGSEDIDVERTTETEDVVIGIKTEAEGRVNYSYYVI